MPTFRSRHLALLVPGLSIVEDKTLSTYFVLISQFKITHQVHFFKKVFSETSPFRHLLLLLYYIVSHFGPRETTILISACAFTLYRVLRPLENPWQTLNFWSPISRPWTSLKLVFGPWKSRYDRKARSKNNAYKFYQNFVAARSKISLWWTKRCFWNSSLIKTCFGWNIIHRQLYNEK